MLFLSGRKEVIANALEIIEIEVSKEFSGQFILLFEDSDEAQKHTPQNEIYVQTNKYTSIVSDILTNHSFHYHRWTKAAAIYCSKLISDSHTMALIKQQQNSTDNLIRETAFSIS